MTPLRTHRMLIAVGLFFLAAPTAAHAYLDPGSGSYLLQILVAGLVAASFAIKSFWASIRHFLGHLFGRRGTDSSSHD